MIKFDKSGNVKNSSTRIQGYERKMPKKNALLTATYSKIVVNLGSYFVSISYQFYYQEITQNTANMS